MITQGKWEAKQYGKTIAIWGVVGNMKCMIAKMNDYRPPESMKADAQLIASAPLTLKQRDELLDALKDAIDMIQLCYATKGSLERLNNLIANVEADNG